MAPGAGPGMTHDMVTKALGIIGDGMAAQQRQLAQLDAQAAAVRTNIQNTAAGPITERNIQMLREHGLVLQRKLTQLQEDLGGGQLVFRQGEDSIAGVASRGGPTSDGMLLS